MRLSHVLSSASLNLTINSTKRAIVMSKKFAKAARLVGSPEYNMLQQARNDYPTYRVETKTTNRKPNPMKGVNYVAIRLYIEKHDASKLPHFDAMIAKIDGVSSMAPAKVIAWFYETFPEVKGFDTFRDALAA